MTKPQEIQKYTVISPLSAFNLLPTQCPASVLASLKVSPILLKLLTSMKIDLSFANQPEHTYRDGRESKCLDFLLCAFLLVFYTI